MQGGPRMVAHSSLWGPRGDTCAHDESMRTVWRSKRSQTGRGLRLGFLRRNPPVHLATVRTRALRQGFLGNPSDPHRDGFFLVFSYFFYPYFLFLPFFILEGRVLSKRNLCSILHVNWYSLPQRSERKPDWPRASAWVSSEKSPGPPCYGHYHF